MVKKPDAAAFLAALQSADEPEARSAAQSPAPAAAPASSPAAAALEATAPAAATVHKLPQAKKGRGARAAKPSRAELKHFGGYVDDETLEKIALLRVRLKKDNSELIVFAVDELFRKHSANRAFGDA